MGVDDRSEIITIINSELRSGSYNYLFNEDSLLTNGIYRIVLNAEGIDKDTSFTEEKICLKNLVDINYMLLKSPPLQIADESGGFFSGYNKLAVKRKIAVTNFENDKIIYYKTVSNNVKFIIHKEGYETLIKEVYIDTLKSTEVTFVLTKKNGNK